MSIFGASIKKGKSLKVELTKDVNSLITRQLTTVKAEQINLFNIYATLNADINNVKNKLNADIGEVKNKLNTGINEVKNKLNTDINEAKNKLNTNISGMLIEHKVVNAKIDKLEKEVSLKSSAKRIITIWAERAEALRKDEMFSFGNGGKIKGVGYTMMHNGRITKMGISTSPLTNNVEVHLIVNGQVRTGFKTTSAVWVDGVPLHTEHIDTYGISIADKHLPENDPEDADHEVPKKQSNYNVATRTFNIPWEVKIGDTIGFKNQENNNNAENTVVSAMIEIDLDT